jgi:hypothetical protein
MILQRILAPLDGSELAEAALPYVEELCCRCEPVKVILLQVLPLPSGRTGAYLRPVEGGYSCERLPDSPIDQEVAQHPIYLEQVMASLHRIGSGLPGRAGRHRVLRRPASRGSLPRPHSG